MLLIRAQVENVDNYNSRDCDVVQVDNISYNTQLCDVVQVENSVYKSQSSSVVQVGESTHIPNPVGDVVQVDHLYRTQYCDIVQVENSVINSANDIGIPVVQVEISNCKATTLGWDLVQVENLLLYKAPAQGNSVVQVDNCDMATLYEVNGDIPLRERELAQVGDLYNPTSIQREGL